MSIWSHMKGLLAPSTKHQCMTAMDFLKNGACPCCETIEPCLLAGPSGGMCIKCGARYNLTLVDIYLIHAEFTHGPQSNIWGGLHPIKFPTPDRVRQVELELSHGW